MHHDDDAVALERLQPLGPFIADEDLHPVTVRDAYVFSDHFDVLRISGGRRRRDEHHCNHKATHAVPPVALGSLLSLILPRRPVSEHMQNLRWPLSLRPGRSLFRSSRPRERARGAALAEWAARNLHYNS